MFHSWNSVIVSSTKLLNKLQFFIQCNEPEAVLEAIKKSKEIPYRNFVLKCLCLKQIKYKPSGIDYTAEPDLKEILINHQDHTKSITMHWFDYILVDLLSIAPNIERLNLNNLYVRCVPFKEGRKVDLPNLKHLQLNRASEFVNCINSPALRVLEIEENENEDRRKELEGVLGRLWNFKELILRNHFYHFTLIKDFNFRLTRFEFDSIEDFRKRHLEEFLMSHKDRKERNRSLLRYLFSFRA